MQHINEKLDEAQFFIRAMTQCSNEIMQKTRFGDAVFVSAHFPVVRVFQYFFSGMLSAWQCAANYMEEAFEGNSEAQKWLLSLRERPLLAAFKHLRDSDIHNKTIKTAMHYVVTMGPTPSTERYFVIDEELRRAKKFSKHPDAVPVLCGRSILELSEDALNELRDVVAEARAKRFL